MAQTAIEWADFSWSPWEGCQKVSEGCKNCYAAERDERFHDGQHWGANASRKMMTEKAKWIAEQEKAK